MDTITLHHLDILNEKIQNQELQNNPTKLINSELSDIEELKKMLTKIYFLNQKKYGNDEVKKVVKDVFERYLIMKDDFLKKEK